MAKKRKYEGRLQASFGFTDDDLEYNRQLEQSPRQKSSRLYQVESFAWVSAVFFLLGLLAALVILINYLVSNESGHFPARDMLLVLLFLGSASVMVYHSLIKSRSDDDEPDWSMKIASVQGVVGLYRSNDKRFLRVRDSEFELTEEQFMAFQHGETYRIYYYFLDRAIASVELVADSAAFVAEENERLEA